MADDWHISAWGTIGAILMSGVALIRSFWRDGRKEQKELEHRLTVVEGAMASIDPQRMVALQVSIERLQGEIRTLAERLTGTAELLNRTDRVVERLEKIHLHEGRP